MYAVVVMLCCVLYSTQASLAVALTRSCCVGLSGTACRYQARRAESEETAWRAVSDWLGLFQFDSAFVGSIAPDRAQIPICSWLSFGV